MVWYYCAMYCALLYISVVLYSQVFHQMANSGVEPNLHTFGALIDGCARAGQVAKAFGAYGILRSKVCIASYHVSRFLILSSCFVATKCFCNIKAIITLMTCSMQ